ncbi:MAG: ribonuclease III [Clostridia bacterium]|nr:ribonuclease III [Erysipelotrichia bacterium]NCC87273.1 ribonuclease III [Clostridia bacterium]
MEIVPYNGNTLAYIGDAVMSLQVRSYLISEKNLQKPNVLQKESVKFVSAKSQAAFLNKMMEEHVLSEDELAIVKRGRNAKSDSVAKNVDVQTYRIATGLEALWGYLYLSNKQERLDELWKYIIQIKEV